MNRSLPAFAIEGLCLWTAGVDRGRLTIVNGRIARNHAPKAIWRLGPELLLLPAFHDHHTHLVGTFRRPQGPALHDCRSRDGCLGEVAAWLRANPGTDPILGEGWDESSWEDSRRLKGADLDTLSSTRAIALRRVCGHLAVVNRAAWELLDPRGIEADPSTGTLTESLALSLPSRWPVAEGDFIEGARLGQSAAAREGVVAIDEIGRLQGFDALRQVDEAGELFLRVRHFFPIELREELAERGIEPGAGSVRVRATGLKAFLDGSIGARTAAVDSPYEDAPGSGMLLWETERLFDETRRGLDAGFAIALHAIGARAIAQALDVFQRVDPRPPGLLRIEHAEQLRAEDLVRAAHLGVSLSMQPNFTARWQGEGGMYARALGDVRRVALNPYRSASARASVVFGSDTMPFGPIAGLPGAVAHPDPGERLVSGEALRAYMPGGIAPGSTPELLAADYPADLVVMRVPGGLDRALRSGTAEVVWFTSGGGILFCDPSAEAPPPLDRVSV